VSKITFLLIIPMQVYNTPFKSWMETGSPLRGWGPTIDIFCVDGGHSQISSTTSQGARHRHFLHLWWVLLDL
jgi:hypothetical protein